MLINRLLRGRNLALKVGVHGLLLANWRSLTYPKYEATSGDSKLAIWSLCSSIFQVNQVCILPLSIDIQITNVDLIMINCILRHLQLIAGSVVRISHD